MSPAQTLTVSPHAVPRSVGFEPGGMGLRGLFGIIGNATAMVVVCVCLFLTGGAAWMMHNQAMNTLERINQANLESMTRVINGNTAAIERNSTVINSLVKEIHALRTGGFGPDE